MRPEQYCSKTLYNLLKKRKTTTLDELKIALGTTSRITVLRKLKELEYISSYSHCGQHYSLKRLVCFDAQGLWSYNGICFSQYGTLMATAEAFVNDSEAGFFVQELDRILHVSTKETMLKLIRLNKIAREKESGLYLYCSADSKKRHQQIKARKLLEIELVLSHGLKGFQVSTDEVKAAIILFLSLLNEKQRRLYAGLESLRCGYGGNRRIAILLGMDVHTVAQGRQEILSKDIEIEQVRQKGGGRTSVKKKRPK